MPRDRVDVYHDPKRAEDFSAVARIASFFLKYNWVLSILLGFFIALGFDFRMPKDIFSEMQEEIKRNREVVFIREDSIVARINAVEVDQRRMLEILEGLAIDACDRLKNDRYARVRLRCQYNNGR